MNLKTLLTASIALLILVLGACGNSPDPRFFLLGPEDLADRSLARERMTSADLGESGVSAEAVLAAQDYKIYHSVVLLLDQAQAQKMMADLLSNPESLGTPIGEPLTLGQETLGIYQDRSADNRSFVIFREGNTLVRVTLEGQSSSQDLATIAQRAWEKLQ